MTVNRECFKRSLMSDIRILGIILSVLIIIGLSLIISYFIGIELYPVIIYLFDICSMPFKTAYGTYIIVSFGMSLLLFISIMTCRKNDFVNKFSTPIFIFCIISFQSMWYFLYYNTSKIFNTQYPSILIETVIILLIALIITPLLVAYKRCKE